MKSIKIKPHHIVYIGVLIVFLVLTGHSFPSNQAAAQEATPFPTPTVTPDPRINPNVLESGNTQGLMIGAAVILLIILGGVLILRLSSQTE